ncbi:somatolactin beta [Brachyhypopomus gauderio]|uniref:somatolactin beta n=1 Tax=Brachyhypopomus gauderio TaxID=698409 RepID=UPI0040429C80
MSKTKVLQGWLLFCSMHGVLGSVLDCEAGEGYCSISTEKLLDRAIQHAELIYRISEETRTQFEEMFIPLDLLTQQGHRPFMCTAVLPMPTSKSEVQRISDKWLLNSVLILVQFWINQLVDLQDSLDQYDNVPGTILNKTKWLSSKLVSLEQGLLTIIRKMLNEDSLPLDAKNTAAPLPSPYTMEQVLKDYSMLSCFRKDAHKMETFLKLFKCRQTNSCSFY